MLRPAPDTLRAMTSVLFSLLLTVRGLAQSRTALHLEVLALRHQLQVLQRSRPQRLQLVYGREIHESASTTSVADMAYVLRESHRAGDGRGLLGGADRDLS